MRNQVLTLIFVLLVVCDEGKAAPKLDIAPRFEATGLTVRFKPQGIDGNVWRIAQAQPVASKPPKSFHEGLIAGEVMAEKIRTRWHVFGGLLIGFIGTPISIGIPHLLIGPADLTDYPEAQSMMSSSGESFDYQKGFAMGWDKKTRSRKGNAYLSGGVVGSLGFLWYYLVFR